MSFFNQNNNAAINKINSQLADIVTNVKSFGAKGDGVTDDTQAFLNAISSTPKNGFVYAPQGTYKLNNPINLTCSLICNGNVTLNANRININANNVKLKGFNLVSFNNTAIYTVGTTGSPMTDILLEDIKISFDSSTSSWLGLLNSYSENLRIRNCKFDKGGIEVDNAYNFVFEDNYFNGEFVNTNEMIHISIHSRGIIHNNFFQNLYMEAIDTFSSGERCIITNNRIENYYDHAVDLKVVIRDSPYTGGSSDQSAYGFVEKTIFKGNEIYNFVPQTAGRYHAVQCYWGDLRATPNTDISKAQAGIEISDNIISDMFTSNPLNLTGVYCAGILVLGDCINVNNNIIKNVQQQGLNAWEACGIQLGDDVSGKMYAYGCNINNNIITSDASGIQVYDARHCNINNNIIKKDERSNLIPRYGIRISYKLDNTNIQGNNIETGYQGSIGIGIVDLAGATTSFLNIVGNIFINGGISLTNSGLNHSILNGNIFNGCTVNITAPSTANGINNTVNNNKFKNTASDYPISINYQSGFIIIGNSFDVCSAAILVNNVSNNGVIIGNVSKGQSYATVVRYLNVVTGDQSTITDQYNIKY